MSSMCRTATRKMERLRARRLGMRRGDNGAIEEEAVVNYKKSHIQAASGQTTVPTLCGTFAAMTETVSRHGNLYGMTICEECRFVYENDDEHERIAA